MQQLTKKKVKNLHTMKFKTFLAYLFKNKCKSTLHGYLSIFWFYFHRDNYKNVQKYNLQKLKKTLQEVVVLHKIDKPLHAQKSTIYQHL